MEKIACLVAVQRVNKKRNKIYFRICGIQTIIQKPIGFFGIELKTGDYIKCLLPFKVYDFERGKSKASELGFNKDCFLYKLKTITKKSKYWKFLTKNMKTFKKGRRTK